MAFLSEIHYKNSAAGQSGITEYVEVSVHPDEMGDLSDLQVVTYQSDGTVRDILNLTDFTPVLDPVTGWYIFQMETLITAPNHTSGTNEAEAVAFIDNGKSPALQDFLDIGGGTTNITATEGPAAGATSTNIPATTGQNSIQFDVFGNRVDGPISEGSSAVCLADGAMVATDKGERPIENLGVGDRVKTRENGFQPIRMIHKRTLNAGDMRKDRSLLPVLIKKGALGFGLPNRDLLVSQQHKMLYSSIRIPLNFAEDAVLVRAKSLTATFDGVRLDSSLQQVTYYHIVLDTHEIIYANGAENESFYPGKEAILSLDGEARTELFKLFPRLRVGERPEELNYLSVRSWEFLAAVA